jgi:hypothetical protein
MVDIAQNMAEYEKYRPVAVNFRDDMVFVTLGDGRVIGNPLHWHPWLARAKPEQLINVQMTYFSVYWPDLDEGLDIEGMFQGIPSAEARQQQAASQSTPNP